ncbi:hypothetical protein [Bradyrhizobium sp. B117]|uniref:hypothetical protein n=1 Tax=Bradyrhizobium sp. B117 TaxID=3140246 RepID=UPI003182F7BF
MAVFFFPKAPQVPPVEQSFRTLPADDFAAIPRTVRLLLRRGQSMQVNLAELNDGKNPAQRLITRDLQFSPNASLDAIATDVRAYLGSLEQQASWKSVEDALEAWREVFAQAGIYVFKGCLPLGQPLRVLPVRRRVSDYLRQQQLSEVEADLHALPRTGAPAFPHERDRHR